MITQDELKRNLIYEPITGMFTRISNGNFCETKSDQGYIIIKINRKLYKAHRLAFLYMVGFIPDEVDHINCVKDDNRWDNLRAATRQQNEQNKFKNKSNTSGYKGVHWHIRKEKWVATIRINGIKKHIGMFDCPIKAYQAYINAADEYHGEFSKF